MSNIRLTFGELSAKWTTLGATLGHHPIYNIVMFCSDIAAMTHTCSLDIQSLHYNDVIMTTMASQITILTVVYSTVYSDANQRKHQVSASLAFVWGIHRDRWIPPTRGQLRKNCFHLMTSSWDMYVTLIIFSKTSLYWFESYSHHSQSVPHRHQCLTHPSTEPCAFLLNIRRQCLKKLKGQLCNLWAYIGKCCS